MFFDIIHNVLIIHYELKCPIVHIAGNICNMYTIYDLYEK